MQLKRNKEMVFETLKKSHKKQIIIGAIAVCVIGGALTFSLTRAKYEIANDLELAKGTINYKAYDFKIMAMYKSEDKTNYTEIEEMPSEGYIVNEEKSYCTTDNINQVKGKVKTIDGNIVITSINKNDKCYVWFDRLDEVKPIISNVTTSVTKTEINVSVTATDNIEVTEYWYQIDSNEPIKGTGNTHKFTGLSAGSTHTIKVYVKDAAGNQSDTTTNSVTTSKPTGSETILANLGTSIKTTTPNFANTATTDEGVYATSDGMYGGTTYYWRGAATTNYLKFAGFCWRIVRINGDGTIRLIYDGTTCHANGQSTTENLILLDQSYNLNYNHSEYVGWTYVDGKQRPEEGDTATNSDAKIKTEEWYKNNIGNKTIYDSKVANGKFCNDREVENGETWVSRGNSFWYVAFNRLNNTVPSLNCVHSDIYNLKVGFITADEVILAGGKRQTNKLYYLYNGYTYWTMTSSRWSSGLYSYADIFKVSSSGEITFENSSAGVYRSLNMRPVINLRSDVTFSGGNGTLNNPYIVS